MEEALRDPIACPPPPIASRMSDDALCWDVPKMDGCSSSSAHVAGRPFAPTGRLPFELPSSMEAVRQQKPDVPYDSQHPLFPFEHGLTY